MKVTIPACEQHEGLHHIEVEIADTCPVCGGSRGTPYEGFSFDGSRRLTVSCWTNDCGHIDRYEDVRLEALGCTSLRQWAISWRPTCELLYPDRLPRGIFIVKTQVGAEHFVALVDCGQQSLEWTALSHVFDLFGMDCPVHVQ